MFQLIFFLFSRC